MTSSWFLRSMGERDTHLGAYSIRTSSVHTLCGLEFQPLRLTTGGPIELSIPPDPDQVCLDCRRVRVAR